MNLQQQEIDELGNALVALGDTQYSDTQQNYLNQFLSEYAQNFNENQVKKVFSDKIQVMDSMKTLNEFAVQYQDEEDIYTEFKLEIEDLLINLNDDNEWISI